MKHSLIIPTRNRQIYVKEAVGYYLSLDRKDIEVIVADNSDDKELIDKELRQYKYDHRLKIIPTENKILNMRYNWERAINESKGRWITVIGDDDAIDPNIVNLLSKIDKEHGDSPIYKSINWSHINYCWEGVFTDNRRPAAIIPIGKNQILGLDSKKTLEQIFNWVKPARSLGSGASIYHGAWRRDLLEEVKVLNSGKIFKFDTAVDYESGYTALKLTERFVHIERPFSILGACPKSNSASMLNLDIADMKRKEHRLEGDSKIYGIKEKEEHPWSLAVVVKHLNEQWALEYKYKYEMNRENFVLGIASEVHNIEPRFFDRYKTEMLNYLINYGYEDLIKIFNPKPREIHQIGWNGILGEKLYLDPTNFAKGILDFAPVAFGCLCPWQRIGQNFKIEANV